MREEHMKKDNLILWIITLSLVFLPIHSLSAAGGQEKEKNRDVEERKEPFDIAVFVPGVVSGSPVYEQLVEGAERAAAEYEHAALKVVEGGFNQSEWVEKVTSLAATGQYEVILTSNPAMPYVAAEVVENFPDQKFINVDGYLEGNPNIYTLLYNQVEQAYFVGYLGGLVTRSGMEGVNSELKVGLIVAQEYPVLKKMIKPGYEKGFKAVNPDIELDYRVIGNWYDANKAADLANSMFDAGVDVVLTIAGGANQGVIKAAKERGKYVLYFDAAEYDIAPGVIIGCAVLQQSKAVYESVKKAVEGNLPYGTAEVVDTEDGFIDFADDDPLYKKHVPMKIREKMTEVVKQMKNGELHFKVPEM